MTSNNKTVSRPKSLSGQQCKIYDVRSEGNSALLPATAVAVAIARFSFCAI